MSIEDVFDEFEKEEKEDKAAPEESTEPSKITESETVPIPEGVDESKDGVEEETPTPSKAEDVDDWFAPAVDESAVEESAGDKPVEDQSIKKEAVSETSAEETPTTDAPAVVDDDWFESAKEETTSDKSMEDQSIEEPAKEKVEEAPLVEETSAIEATTEVEDEWFIPAPEEQASAEIPTQVTVDKGTLISIEASPIVSPAISPEAMRKQMKNFQSLKASLLDKSTDIAQIQGKPFVKRSGWRKLGLVFNISDEIIKAEKEDIGDDFEWRFWVKATAPNGRSAVGIGGCCSDEREFTHRRHDVLAVAHTRAKNRALSDLIGSGEVSWEELRGMG